MVATRPQATVMKAIQRRGVKRLRTRLEGIWKGQWAKVFRGVGKLASKMMSG
jgi:hypothetical protein